MDNLMKFERQAGLIKIVVVSIVIVCFTYIVYNGYHGLANPKSESEYEQKYFLPTNAIVLNNLGNGWHNVLINNQEFLYRRTSNGIITLTPVINHINVLAEQ